MSNDGVPLAQHLFRLWLRKGHPFTLTMTGNPPVEHDGGNTVVHLVLTPDQQEQITNLLQTLPGNGCEWDLIPHERQSALQTKERQTLLGLHRGDRVWPSATCPACAWFDPLLEGEPCGRVGWPPESIAALDTMDAPRKDAEACPVPHVWWGKVG